ncbi:extracellular solute-binding protein [Paenibacillus cymbidii]|uniref:extracellular solute-binding protein n=1 Tax=Paenibacillus cymbidii TaxID=1639034 RepID=UPI001F40965E|nr:extracellular solute-binding protein [Paenibacillus cymbidii]
MKSKSLSVALAIVLAMTVVAACSKGNDAASSATPAQKSASPSATNTAKAEKPLYTVKYLNPGALGNPNITKSDQTEIGKIIKDKFNIVFEYVPYPGSWEEKANLMLAARDYPEILWIQSNTTLDKYIKAGALAELDPYLADSPNFTKRYEKMIPLWRLASNDGKLYNWQKDQSDLNTNVRGNDIGVRIDALAKQGYPKLLSEDDWVGFLKQAVKDFPTAPNGQKTIGMVSPWGESWGVAGIAGAMHEKGGTYTGLAGNEGVIFNSETMKYEDYFLNRYVQESYHFFNRLHREGLLDPEIFTDKSAQMKEKVLSGRAISTWYSIPGYSDNVKIKEAGHPEMQYIAQPVRTNTQVQENKKRLIMELDTGTFLNLVITKNAKDPKRLMELVDWASSEEGMTLLQAGIEGKHYNVQNGKRVPTDLYYKEVQDPQSTVGFGYFTFLGNDLRLGGNGQPYSFTNDWDFKDKLVQTPETMEAFGKLGWKTSVDYWKATTTGAPSGIITTVRIEPTSELGQLHQKMTEFRVKNTSKLVLAKSEDEFYKIQKDLTEEYKKLNPERVINEYNKLYDELSKKVK